MNFNAKLELDPSVVSQNVIQAILAGPDYFTCEKMHTRMNKADCIVRQTRGLRTSAIGNYREVPPECEDCEQGLEIRGQRAEGRDQRSEIRGLSDE